MIAPERWYEYEKKYQRYGFDMKPESELPDRRRKKTAKKITIPFANGRKVAFSMILAVGAAMIMLIIITAYSANMRYDINSMIGQNNEIMGEIENLQVKVYSANNIDYIEGKATGALNIVYPSSKKRVYISMDDVPEKGFADIIKEKAYN